MVMKSIYACLLVLLLTTMTTFAQDQQPPNTTDMVAKMQAALNLTQDQVTAITPIIDKYSSKRDDLRQSMEDGTADRDSIRTQMKQLRVDEGQELSQVLSADQMAKWKKIMSQGKHRHSEGKTQPNEGEGTGNIDAPPPPQQ